MLLIRLRIYLLYHFIFKLSIKNERTFYFIFVKTIIRLGPCDSKRITYMIRGKMMS